MVITWDPSDNTKELARILRKIIVSHPATEYKKNYVTSHLGRRVLTALRVYNLLGIQKATWNMNNQKNFYHIPSYSYYLPILDNYLCWIWYTEEKVKIGQPIIPFPLSPSLFISKPKAECWKNMHLSKIKIKAAELVLYSASTVLI